jgi:uncharacterized membrane protein (UPF0127 family)
MMHHVESRSRPWLAALGLLLAISASCGQTGSHSSLPRGTVSLGPNRVLLHVEIADTDAARLRGLMGRRSLGADSGMVFLFDAPVRASFYMENTLIPLSIAFWDQTDRIVSILDMVPCRATPCSTYTAGSPFVGAVEANRGFFVEHGVEVGDDVELER